MIEVRLGKDTDEWRNICSCITGVEFPNHRKRRPRPWQPWGAWFGQLGSAVVDGGNPTGASVTVGAGGAATPGGGANPTTGYSLIEALSLDDATAKAKGCPIVSDGGSVEVCETINMEG